ncbi:NADP-dependent oxidoreductase [Nocardia sp. CDC160]|uniref:NADP-dependent oxidoreductase n=1 Tax=Nocardia sp. CDC160 TaxID=3112166 RepID=UPI002DBE01B8|nr:NADP-dependent oxidoreductase [Nocardia sp. CDC160]MEC3918163.1 NADP-dependent oxidoreductase [Nocardia sp. CDC160]
MRAVVIRSFGGPEVLELAEVPMPRAGVGQIRIKVVAAAVNPVDLHTRSGGLAQAGLMVPREVIGLGWDVAGTIDEIGSGVVDFAVGDEVYGLSDRLDVPLGTHADHVVLDATAVAHAPRTVSAIEAASVPLGALTAAQSLDLLALTAGRTVLITGAAGAVGGFAVELAVARGLRVVATSRADDEALVRKLGAKFFVPRGVRLGEAVRALVPGGVDGAVDAASLGAEALDAVRSRGAFAAVVGGAEPVGLRGIRVDNTWIRADGRQLAELAALIDTGRLTPRVAETLPLDSVAAAHHRLADTSLRGRLVLHP